MRQITSIIGLIFSGLIIYYLNNLEKIGCSCAITPQRNYIYYYTIVLVLFNVVNMFLLPSMNKNIIKSFLIIMGPLALLLLIGGIINVVYTIQFVQDMKQKNCECSKSVFREMMFILSILQIISWIILILILMYIIVIYKQPGLMKTILKKIKLKK